MIKKFERFILKNWFWIILGCILTKKCIELAYIERGYKAVGGEYLVLPLLLMVVQLVRDMSRGVRYLLSQEVEEDE